MTQLCIDFGGTNIKLGLWNNGSVVASEEFRVSGTTRDLATVERRSRALCAGAAVTGVGIAVPGVVDRRAGRLVRAHGKYEYLDGVDLKAWGEAQFGASVALENDARAALIGETAYGCAAGEKDAVMVTLGTGIGTAAIIDGVVLRGAHDHAGILGGHLTVDVDGPRCSCGNIGCAEALASTWAIGGLLGELPAHGEHAGRDADEPIGMKEIIEAALAPDPDAVAGRVLDRFCRVWGAVIVGLCHAYDPDVVIVSGGIMRAGDLLLPRFQEYADAYLWSSSYRPRFVTPERPDLSVLRGLAAIAGATEASSRTVRSTCGPE